MGFVTFMPGAAHCFVALAILLAIIGGFYLAAWSIATGLSKIKRKHDITDSTIKCDKCGGPFDPTKTPAGLAFSPPKERKAIKYHICPECWPLFLKWIKQ